MRRAVEGTAAALVISAAVFFVNLGLFSLIPVLHRIFVDTVTQAVSKRPLQKIIMEYKKPEQKETAPRERRIRRIVAPNRRRGASELQFKFTPDLTVEGTGEVASMEQQELEAVIFEEGETDEAVVPLYQPSIP
ncbi:MAG: hypothetical protein JXA18_04015, partial [Chitinispirillaceae bacterium]|nr:hypothetical protein [Chitinispirillaceae bacterium]